MILDDDHDDVFILTRLLRKAGIQNKVMAFEDPRAAFAFLEGESLKPHDPFMPILVFTDYHMPGMNGCEFIARVRELPGTASLPIFLISGLAEPGDHERATAAGATGIYDKYPNSKTLAEIARHHGCTLSPPG